MTDRCGYLNLVRHLVDEERAPIEEVDCKWFATPLHHACRKNHLSVVDYLVSEGADVNAETSDSNYFTCLHWYLPPFH